MPQEILPSETILQRYGKSLAGKTILITGVADTSIAGELAVQLSAVDPALLILTARDESKVAPIQAQIRATKPNVATRFLKMDLGDLSSIEQAVDSVSDVSKIDHVACVAGVMIPPYGKTKDGFETQFGVNYLANFVFVKLILDKVRAAGEGASVIIVASSAVRFGVVNFEDVGYSDGKTYEPMPAYSQSNAARVMFVKSLARKLEGQGIRVFSIDPGSVKSGLQRHFNSEFLDSVAKMRESGSLIDVDGTPFPYPTPTGRSEGAATIITGMIDPTITFQDNGSFLHNNAIANDELHRHILDETNWERLWKLSEEMVGAPFTV